jgi:hypothetical protein
MTAAKTKPKFGPSPRRAAPDPAAVDAFVSRGAEKPAEPQVQEPEKPAEKVKMKRLTVDLDPAFHREVKKKAADTGEAIVDVIRRLLGEWLEQ